MSLAHSQPLLAQYFTSSYYKPPYEKLDNVNSESINELTVKVSAKTKPIILPVEDGFIIGMTVSYSTTRVPKMSAMLIPLLYKVDVEGNLLWSREYDSINIRGSMTNIFVYENGDIGFSISMVPNIRSNVSSVFYNNEKAFIIKCDSQGEELWTRIYEDKCGELFNHIFVTENQHLLTVGVTIKNIQGMYSSVKPTIEDGSNIIVMDIDSEGNPIKENRYGGLEYEFTLGAAYSPEVGLVISGESYSYDGALVEENKFSKEDIQIVKSLLWMTIFI